MSPSVSLIFIIILATLRDSSLVSAQFGQPTNANPFVDQVFRYSVSAGHTGYDGGAGCGYGRAGGKMG